MPSNKTTYSRAAILKFFKENINPDRADYLAPAELLELERSMSDWAAYFYPKRFNRPFTAYQVEFCDWFASMLPGAEPQRPRAECEPRGVGKSTIGRTGVVYLLAKKVKSYCLIVSATENQAKKHFAAVKKQLENPKLLAQYPHLKPQQSVHRNMSTNWSADRLVTEEGQVVEFISIMGNARGFNTEEGRRLDFIMIDDIDDQKDSVDVTEKKLDILASNILGAGDDQTDVVFLQNLIHRTSICARLRDNTAGILVNRHFVGPYPLCSLVDYAEEPIPGDMTGAKQYVLIDFQPFDPATSAEYATSLLNRLGPKTFMRECQQDLTVVDEDKDFREYSEIFHVITYSEFYTYWKKFGVPVLNEERQTLQIPSQWNVGLGQDWGTTVDHPASIAPVARPNKAVPLNDSFFLFGEVVLPHYPHDVNKVPELVSPGRVAAAEVEHLKRWNVQELQVTICLMSHEASAARNTYSEDLTDDLKRYYGKWKAARGSGVPQVQNVLQINYTEDHPFRRYPKDHPDKAKRGKPIKGRPKFYILVPDDQGALMCDAAGHLYVKQPTNSAGCARLRAEMPVYSHRNTGKKKIFDDMVDALRGLAGEYMIMPQPLTSEERYQEYLGKMAPDLLPGSVVMARNAEEQSLIHARERVMRAEFEEAEKNRRRIRDEGFADYSAEVDPNSKDWREL